MFKTKEEMHKEKTNFDRENLSDQYAPVSTELLLMPFTNRGWYVHKHKTQFNDKGLGKEIVTLRNDNYVYPNGDFLTVEALNSNNGSCSLILMGGYGRIACSNGLVIGDMASGRFVHRGRAIYEKLENQYEKIVAHLDKIKQDVETLKSVNMTADQVDQAIQTIARKTFEVDSKTKKVEVIGFGYGTLRRLVRVRRIEDAGKDAFTVMNRVQEAILRHGDLTVQIRETNKETGEEKVRFTTKQRHEHRVSSVGTNKLITEAFLKAIA